MSDIGALYWLGGMALVIGLLGIVGMLGFYIDRRITRWQEHKGRQMGTWKDEDE